jgi:nitrite reductase/ring-hydroxylating ferredoxin subunit
VHAGACASIIVVLLIAMGDKHRMDDWHLALAAPILVEGQPLHAEIRGVDVLFLRIAGAVHAVSNLCTHADACLHEGRLRGHRIICPLHGASFDVRTGAVLAKPASVGLQRYEVREEDGHIHVRLPRVT